MRKLFFWVHLTTGVLAGLVVLIMSATGVLLTYERQMIAWADREYKSSRPSLATPRLGVEALLENVRTQQGELPDALTLYSNPAAPAQAGFGRERTLFIDVYSGAVLGEGSKPIRSFFRTVTDWHRWLGAQGPNRATGRAITGACNLAFLFLVVSGFYLWFPRKWTPNNFRAVLLFRGGLRGKARDFNWHNVIGVWSAVPLFFIVLGGVVISYPWATALIYRATGGEPPRQTGRPAGRGGPDGGEGRIGHERHSPSLQGIDAAWNVAEQTIAGWHEISLRIPASAGAPLTFAIAESHRGRPDKRSQLTIGRSTSRLVSVEDFSSYNLGRRIRTWLRWIHTGEAGGVVGQTIAGLVSAGAVVLVWTGVALSLRRWAAWRARNRERKAEANRVPVTM